MGAETCDKSEAFVARVGSLLDASWTSTELLGKKEQKQKRQKRQRRPRASVGFYECYVGNVLFPQLWPAREGKERSYLLLDSEEVGRVG